jgi:hypothetical protein
VRLGQICGFGWLEPRLYIRELIYVSLIKKEGVTYMSLINNRYVLLSEGPAINSMTSSINRSSRPKSIPANVIATHARRRRQQKHSPSRLWTNLQFDFPIETPQFTIYRQIPKTSTNMASNLTRKELLGKVYKMVPPMLEKFHKGKLLLKPLQCLTMLDTLLTTNQVSSAE